jgi:hypothetical protein
LWRR